MLNFILRGRSILSVTAHVMPCPTEKMAKLVLGALQVLRNIASTPAYAAEGILSPVNPSN